MMLQYFLIIFVRILIDIMNLFHFFLYSLIHSAVMIFIKYNMLTAFHWPVRYNMIYLHFLSPFSISLLPPHKRTFTCFHLFEFQFRFHHALQQGFLYLIFFVYFRLKLHQLFVICGKFRVHHFQLKF